MALSFGRGKKGGSDDAASNAAPKVAAGAGANTSDGTEGLDESWFEGAFDEESAAPQVAPAPVPSVYAAPPSTTPASDFDMFADLEAQGNQPAQSASFDMEEATPAMTASTGAEGLTPFDTTTVAPTKAKGGLKKILPVLVGLVVLSGGAYFWISQQSSDNGDPDTTLPSATSPAPVARPGATTAGATTPPAVKPTAANPVIVIPTGKTPPMAAGDAKAKAQLKKLWDEGAMAKKAGKIADARKKWQEAVKLGNSTPSTKQSATMIQAAIDKLK